MPRQQSGQLSVADGYVVAMTKLLLLEGRQNKSPADLGRLQLPWARANRAYAPSRDGLKSILLLPIIPEIYAKWGCDDLSFAELGAQ